MFRKLRLSRDYKQARLTARKSWLNKKYKRGHWSRVNKCGITHLESELTKVLADEIQKHIDRQIVEEIKRWKTSGCNI